MTKKVRIENADTSPYKVLVQAWDKGFEGAPDTLAAEIILAHPGDLTGDYCPGVYITSTRYLIVKELEE